MTIWGFADEEPAIEAFAALPRLGFSPLAEGGEVLASGEPRQIDPVRRDQADPWKGRLGQPSIVRRHERTFLQSDDPNLDPVEGSSAAIGGTAVGRVLKAWLDAQPRKVVQAVFFGPALGLAAGADPAALLTPRPGEARALLDRSLADPPPGVPLYAGGVLADLEAASGSALLLALAYSDCQTAGTAAERAAPLWPEAAGGTLAGTPQLVTADAGQAGCAMVVHVPPVSSGNQFTRVFDAMMRQDFALVRLQGE